MLKIDFWNIAFTIINLLVLYFFMKHFLIGPVKQILDDRKNMIEHDLDAASAAKEEANQLKETYAASINAAGEEASRIVEDARSRARAEYDRIVSQANADAAKKLEHADQTIALEKEKALHDLKASVAELAMTAAEKVLGDQSGPDRDRQLYQSFLAESGDGHE